MKTPTEEQTKILQEDSSCVVVARPGSGKTFTLSYKIREIISSLPEYRGVIAISYTNKASEELRDRVLALGIQKKSNFFGTIDNFCLTEIVIPFLRHRFGPPIVDIKILKASNSCLLLQLCPNGTEKMTWEIIETLYKNGEIILDLSGRTALQLLKTNKVLREYMKSRYSHIMIDEYQDSGKEQHCIFMELFSLGIIAIAVGDLDQSIFAFAGKSSDFLYELTQNENFKKYALTVNRRCHPSIAEYSLKLINPSFSTSASNEKRVYSKIVQGHQSHIAQFIEKSIPALQSKFKVEKLGEIAILCRSNGTAKLIKDSMRNYKIQFREDTPLDSLSFPWAIFFTEALYCLFDPAISVNELFEKYLGGNVLKGHQKKSLAKMIQLKKETNEFSLNKLKGSGGLLKEVAEMLIPISEKRESERALLDVLGANNYLLSYFPKKESHIQAMTLHKSKGLEFDIVFHLDLYQWILPSYQAVKGNKNEMRQSVNLHYVGITRARIACILLSSTQKLDLKSNVVKDATVSDFLKRADLVNLRKVL